MTESPTTSPATRRHHRLASTVLLAVVALLASGCSLWGFGRNVGGQLGNGTNLGTNSPIQAGVDTDWFLGTAARGDTSCAIRDDFSLWCSGDGGQGQLGNGTFDSSLVYVQVGTATDWRSVATGLGFTCGVRSGGTLWCWGTNALGQAGQGVMGGDYTVPTQVGSATDWQSVGAGVSHACALRSTGTLWCWGTNGFGKLGLGTSSGIVTSPVQSGGDSDWAYLGVGQDHTCAVKTSGSLWCWGLNNEGQVGDGSTTNRNTATQVGIANDWVTVSGGSWNTCGTRSGGTAWCWGYNGEGAVGDGTGIDRLDPAQVVGVTGWTSISNGTGHTCGIAARKLYCWGANFHGQVGDGTNTDRLAPVQIGTATDWVFAYAGNLSTQAFKG